MNMSKIREQCHNLVYNFHNFCKEQAFNSELKEKQLYTQLCLSLLNPVKFEYN